VGYLARGGGVGGERVEHVRQQLEGVGDERDGTAEQPTTIPPTPLRLQYGACANTFDA
jgi:hypothetical protein